MIGPIVLDTNLLLLLVFGTTSKDYIALHKRLATDFTYLHYELLVEWTGRFSDIVLVPHIVAETSSLLRHIANPKRRSIQATFQKLISSTIEYPVPSAMGAARDEFQDLGITDAVILHLLSLNEMAPTLLTIDQPLSNRANALGYCVLDFRQFMD